jgi:PmbA protein
MTYQEFKETVTAIARDMQIADYELYYTEGDSTSVEIYKDEVKSYSVEEELGVCFRCIVDGRAGYASTENLTTQEARSLVQRAYEMPDPWRVRR